jgi:hypothetical protein
MLTTAENAEERENASKPFLVGPGILSARYSQYEVCENCG